MESNVAPNFGIYKPSILLRHAHVNTIFTARCRRTPMVESQKVSIETPDGDFFDIEQNRSNRNELVIVLHGLEGDTESQYIRGLCYHLHHHNFDFIAVNHRSCGGQMNRLPTMYHSGFTQDLHFLVEKYADAYKQIHIVGFSLGGNITLKYISDGYYSLPETVSKVVAVSVPMDLAGSLQEILKLKNKIYDKMFLSTLKKKIVEKHKQFPDHIPIEKMKLVKNLYDIDEFFTGPLHGFKGADDYYEKCSALPLLHNASVKTLIINALDDPFLSPACYPKKDSFTNPNVQLLYPSYGGHVGFFDTHKTCWHESVIIKYLHQ